MKHHYREAKFLKKGERLRDFVFGYNDGAVTTLAVITALTTGSAGGFVVILGALANIFGSGISFALGDYISTKSQIEVFKTYVTNKRISRHERMEAQDIMSQFDKPSKIAGIAFGSFVLAGLIALSPFLFLKGIGALAISIFITFASVFLVGLLRARYTHGNALRSGSEMLLIATLALVAAYFIGTYGLSLLGLM